MLGLVGLKEAADRLARTYSGGMKKRLELISGLIHKPKVLFLDEPTLGLDIQTRLAMWEYIKGINKDENMTIFLTTHYLEEADSLCGRVAIIDHGHPQRNGVPRHVLEDERLPRRVRRGLAPSLGVAAPSVVALHAPIELGRRLVSTPGLQEPPERFTMAALRAIDPRGRK